MLIEYVEEALRMAKYEIIADEDPFYGEIAELKGVWATGKTLEECRENLKEVIEGPYSGGTPDLCLHDTRSPHAVTSA